MFKKTFFFLMVSVLLMTSAAVHLMAAEEAELPTITLVDGDPRSYSIDKLVDGIFGSSAVTNDLGQVFNNGTYTGIQFTDLTVDIDLHEVKKIDEIAVGFLWDGGRWSIGFPNAVKFEISTDGSTFEEYAEITDVSEFTTKEDFYIHRVTSPKKEMEAQYVRVTVSASWDYDWFFIDEISIHEAGTASLAESIAEAERIAAEAAEAAKKAAEEAAAEEAAFIASRPAAVVVSGDIQNYSIFTLVDGTYGSMEPNSSDQVFSNGTFVGVKNSSLVVDIDMREEKTFEGMSVGCLLEPRFGIEYPASVQFEISKDGTVFEEYAVLDLTGITSEEAKDFYTASAMGSVAQAQYVRITVTPKEGVQWFFLDEFSMMEVEAAPEAETAPEAAPEAEAVPEAEAAPEVEAVPEETVVAAPQTADIISILMALSAVSALALSAVRKKK